MDIDQKRVMDIDPQHYNETCKLTYAKAGELIDIIIKENPNKEFNYVLDIGCGSGNATDILNSRLNIKQLYAIDVDEVMIKFAKNNYLHNNMEYLVQDISVEWNQLRPEIKALEGKCSLIFSNYVLHWIKEKSNTAINIFRLLSTDGVLYANIQYLCDPFSNLNSTEKEILEQSIKIPSSEQQLNLWKLTFKNAGFKAIDMQLSITEFPYETKGYETTMVPIAIMLRQTFITEKNEQKKKRLIERMKEKLIENAPEYFDQITGKRMVRYVSKVFITKLIKNAY